MKKCTIIFFISLLLIKNTFTAEYAARALVVTPAPPAEQITPTTYLINNPLFPKGIEYKYLDKFKEFLASKTKQTEQVNQLILRNLHTDDALLSISADDLLALLGDQAKCRLFVERFYRLYTLIGLINNQLDERYSDCGQDGLCCNNNLGRLISKIDNPYLVEFFFFFNRIQTAVGEYQQKRDGSIFYLLSDPNFFKNLLRFNRNLTNPYFILLIARSCRAVRDMYRILIKDLFLSPPIASAAVDSSFPFLQFFDEQELRLKTFFISFDEKPFTKDEGIKRFKESICKDHAKKECSMSHFFGENNFIHFDSIHRKLIVTFPEEFKRAYQAVYNKATDNGRSQLQLTVQDFWTKKLSLPITFSIPDIFDGKISGDSSLKSAIVKGEKAIAKEVEAILADLGWAEEKGTEKKASKKKETLTAGASQKKSTPKTSGAAAHDSSAEEPIVEEMAPEYSFYTFNRALNSKRIEVDDRVSDWYKIDQGESLALKKQGYLTPGTDRNKILKDVSEKYGSRKKGVQEIIFTHQLPYSLLRSIISYGTIAGGSTNAHTAITALICVEKEKVSTYYQAEVAGEIKGKTFRIWHSFLRPIDDINSFISSTLEGYPMKPISDDLEESPDSHFTLLGEDKGWITNDQGTHVAISNGPIQYILFKN